MARPGGAWRGSCGGAKGPSARISKREQIVADCDRKKISHSNFNALCPTYRAIYTGDRIPSKTLDLVSVGVCLMKSKSSAGEFVPMAGPPMGHREKKKF